MDPPAAGFLRWPRCFLCCFCQCLRWNLPLLFFFFSPPSPTPGAVVHPDVHLHWDVQHSTQVWLLRVPSVGQSSGRVHGCDLLPPDPHLGRRRHLQGNRNAEGSQYHRHCRSVSSGLSHTHTVAVITFWTRRIFNHGFFFHAAFPEVHPTAEHVEVQQHKHHQAGGGKHGAWEGGGAVHCHAHWHGLYCHDVGVWEPGVTLREDSLFCVMWFFFFINYHDAKGPGWALVDVSKDCVLQDSVDELLFIIYTKAYYYTVFLLLFFFCLCFLIYTTSSSASPPFMCHVTILFCYYLLST